MADRIRTAPPNGDQHLVSSKALLIFVSYAHEDAEFLTPLKKWLVPLTRRGLIKKAWTDREIFPGEDWREKISDNLSSADLILLLISQDFLASEYCHEVEMKAAIQRHDDGLARVIPIIVREADWQHSELSFLQALPSGGRPVSQWTDRDSAYADIAKGIEKAITNSWTDKASSEDGPEVNPATDVAYEPATDVVYEPTMDLTYEPTTDLTYEPTTTDDLGKENWFWRFRRIALMISALVVMLIAFGWFELHQTTVVVDERDLYSFHEEFETQVDNGTTFESWVQKYQDEYIILTDCYIQEVLDGSYFLNDLPPSNDSAKTKKAPRGYDTMASFSDGSDRAADRSTGHRIQGKVSQLHPEHGIKLINCRFVP